jgi:hypothetical protein
MAIWGLIQPLIILAITLILIQQLVYPICINKPVFPFFRRSSAKKIVKKIEAMDAKKALDLVDFHSKEILRFITTAESYAENEEREAKEKLKKALDTVETVKERAQKLNTINLNKKEGI